VATAGETTINNEQQNDGGGDSGGKEAAAAAAAGAAAAAAMVAAAVAAAMTVGREIEEARGEEIGVTRMQVRVPRIHIGDNLAQIIAMRLANVQTFGSNVWRPNINLSAPQIDFSCGADRKMVIFYV
jgi:hypothetical protein